MDFVSSRPRIPRTEIWRALPPDEHRYSRAELVTMLVDLCFLNEELRREAEEDGKPDEAAERVGEIIAYRTLLRLLFLSTKDKTLTSPSRKLLEQIDRCLLR